MLFGDNPRRRSVALSDRQLEELCCHSAARYSELPMFHRGESCEIRNTDARGILIQRLIPSLNSITHQRKGTIEGSERLRLDISQIFWEALHRQGLATCHLAREGAYLLMTQEDIPPVEVIVKAAMTGTPRRIYHGLFERKDRFGRPFEPHQSHPPYVRFDYRNPLQSGKGERLRDECLPLGLAHRLIATDRAQANALAAFDVIRRTLQHCGLDVLDACFLYDAQGEVLAYEISPDNMRVKGAGWVDSGCPDTEFDKDLWRGGADHAMLMAQWQALLRRLRQGHG